MRKIDLNGIKDIPESCKHLKVYASKHIPPKGFIGITLFNRVVIRDEINIIYEGIHIKTVEEFLSIEWGRTTLNHERLHTLQVKSLTWIIFYIFYLYYYLKYLIRTKNSYTAYKSIPFEIEAYTNETDYDYNSTHWKEFIIK